MTHDEIMFCYKIILKSINKNDVQTIGCLNKLLQKAKESQPLKFIPSEKLQEEILWLQSRIRGYKTQIQNQKEEIINLKSDRRKKLLSIRELRESVKELKKPKEVKRKKSGPGVLYYNNDVNEWLDLMKDLNGILGDDKDD